MKTILDYQEACFKAGDTLAELVMNSQKEDFEFEDGTAAFTNVTINKGKSDEIRLYYREKRVFSIGSEFRESVEKQLYELLSLLYKEREEDRLKATIAEAQAKLNKLNKQTA